MGSPPRPDIGRRTGWCFWPCYGLAEARRKRRDRVVLRLELKQQTDRERVSGAQRLACDGRVAKLFACLCVGADCWASLSQF